jgi:hypothetical protein
MIASAHICFKIYQTQNPNEVLFNKVSITNSDEEATGIHEIYTSNLKTLTRIANHRNAHHYTLSIQYFSKEEDDELNNVVIHQPYLISGTKFAPYLKHQLTAAQENRHIFKLGK